MQCDAIHNDGYLVSQFLDGTAWSPYGGSTTPRLAEDCIGGDEDTICVAGRAMDIKSSPLPFGHPPLLEGSLRSSSLRGGRKIPPGFENSAAADPCRMMDALRFGFLRLTSTYWHCLTPAQVNRQSQSMLPAPVMETVLLYRIGCFREACEHPRS